MKLQTLERKLYNILGGDNSINCIEEITEDVIVLSSPGNRFPLGAVNELLRENGYYNAGFGMVHHIYTFLKRK